MLRNSKIAWIISFIYFSCVFANVSARCVHNYKVLNWEFEYHSPPPARLAQKLTVSGAYDNQTEIKVWLKDRREDFNFTLLADPFVKNESDCPRQLQKHENLRQFFKTCSVLEDDEEAVSRSFGSIFTGCYYFVMTNKSGKNWHHPPIFYNTNYRFLDTKLELTEQVNFIPEGRDSTMELRVILKVPLRCISVKARLFQHDPNTANAFDEIKNGRIPESQKCHFRMIEEEVTPDCQTSALFTNLTLAISANRRDDGWTGRIVWKKLQRGGGKYYLNFMGNPTSTCPQIYRAEDLYTWRPIDGEIWRNFGHTYYKDRPSEDPASFPFWFSIGYPIFSCVVFGILCYWAWKYYRIAWDCFFGGSPDPPDFLGTETPPDRQVSGQILLLYGKGSPKFMKEMCAFRDLLKRYCGNCSVHDVYSDSDLNRVSELGAAGWVHELLRAGSQVVWVDTPQLRCQCNDKQKRHTAQDFRDDALPYAVCVATDSFQNANTQYLRHFVVRVKGYEVRDRDDDPLEEVAPHARYYIPEQLSLLYEHLSTSMRCLKFKGDEEIEIQSGGESESDRALTEQYDYLSVATRDICENERS